MTKKKWDKIIYNLVSNAIKYTPEGGEIHIGLKETSYKTTTCLHLIVKDSGVGIKESQLKQIFNRFYQAEGSATRRQEGTGIGLALVKELVELQNGTITVTSELNQGTTFEVTLPILEATTTATVEEDLLINEAITNFLALETWEEPKQEKTIKIEDKEVLKILVIEDNAALRAYIQDCIGKEEYIIEEATNGIAGIEKAITIVPDLIISDIMMPGKDGFEVTQTIRSTLATSHIPIILLTAKASLESRLQGLKSGADVYLTKPFSPKELNLRIQKLIEIRQLIQQHVEQPTAEKIIPTAYEKENFFLQEVRWIIINNLNNQQLNGEFISQELRLSRMQVHRKIKALVNQSASQMIKEIRLQNAHELLLTKNYNISEVAYRTGFNTVAYFSKTYKEKFGCSPSELLKQSVKN